ncbi:MAG: EAL domain-containing protein [Calditerrivibrio sp.]|uniref:EAL domain-containing protein n=1 Tax=Calditerrivibrio sp. TaxID=2792612 RepID=UPI003D0C6106
MKHIFFEKWEKKLEKIDYAVQPIVSTLSGKLFGVEFLIRGVEEIGFKSISSFFDEAYEDQVLVPLEKTLRKKVAEKASKIKNYRNINIFYNYDHRIMEMPDYTFGFTEQVLGEYKIPPSNWCLELNEGLNHSFTAIYNKVLLRAKASGFKLAIDDFGTGFSNFELLYHSEADYIKLDKFLIREIHKDNRKISLVSAIKDIARSLGITLIAEGVETEEEYYCLKNFNIEFIQGYFIQKPTTDPYSIKLKYENIESLYNSDRRKSTGFNSRIKEAMVFIPPLKIDSSIGDLFTRFQNSNYDFIPLVDTNFAPVGVVFETDLREYIYSPFGRELLTSKLHKKTIKDFMKKMPKVDIRTKIDDVLKLIVTFDSQGIFVTNDNEYVGFLPNNAVLKILNEIRIQEALETNPLTGLPGNAAIAANINKILKDEDNVNYVVYFDFDNFKPFNDKFGFRVGDRAIKGFGEILKDLKRREDKEIFIGHIGGDDFFMSISFKEYETEAVIKMILNIIDEFQKLSTSFYSFEEIVNKSYQSVDRSGNLKNFPLLGISAAIIELPKISIEITDQDFSKLIAVLKKNAKSNGSKISISTLLNR